MNIKEIEANLMELSELYERLKIAQEKEISLFKYYYFKKFQFMEFEHKFQAFTIQLTINRMKKLIDNTKNFKIDEFSILKENDKHNKKHVVKKVQQSKLHRFLNILKKK